MHCAGAHQKHLSCSCVSPCQLQLHLPPLSPSLQAPDYSGSCGRCYEIACRPDKNLRDGNGNQMDRSYSCKEGAKVTVTITDTCPCYYPSNQYSNQRW